MNASRENLLKGDLLVVDDKPQNLIAMQAVFGSDYNLLFAHSGYEALELLKKNEVDVILLDVQMPEMDGYETARQIKQLESCQNIPIVFITAIFTQDPAIKKGYQAGGIDYFTKPFDPELLKRKIDIYTLYRRQSSLLKEKEVRIKELEEKLKRSQVNL